MRFFKQQVSGAPNTFLSYCPGGLGAVSPQRKFARERSELIVQWFWFVHNHPPSQICLHGFIICTYYKGFRG